VDNFLDTYELPKFNQEAINSLTSSRPSHEIKAVMKSLPTKTSPGPDGFTAELYQTFKKDLTPMLLKIFCKIEREGMLQNSAYKAKPVLP
jgi:hypothetical protein